MAATLNPVEEVGEIMTVSFVSFADELEKIAASRLQKMYAAGKVSLDDVLRAAKEQRSYPRIVSKAFDGGRRGRLIKIRTDRYIKKGLSPREAERAAKSGLDAAGETLQHGSLRTELQEAAAKGRGASQEEITRLGFQQAREKSVLQGESSPAVLVKSWKGNRPGAEKALTAAEKTELSGEMAQLGMKREMGGTRTAGQKLFRAKTPLGKDIAQRDTMRAEARASAEKALKERKAAEAAAKKRAAQTELELKQGAAARAEQKRLAAMPPAKPAPAPAPKPAPAPAAVAPAPRPAPAPAPAPTVTSASRPAPAPVASAPVPAATPASGGGGVHPGLIAAGVGAPLVLGAGGLAAHHLAKRRQQAQ